MINTSYCVKALNISWLRRVIKNPHNNARYSVKHRFCVTFSYGQGYPSLLVTNIRNPFWKDLLLSWASFCKIFKVENI